MRLGLFLRREWVTSIRSRRLFLLRRNSAALVGLFAAGTFAVWDRRGWDRASVSGAARFGHWLFAMIMVAQLVLAIGLLGSLTPSIAAERDRKSIDALLATRLSSAQIILGNLAAGLVRYVNSLAATLPIVVLIVMLGGIDLGSATLTFACLGSLMFSLAALSVAISAGSRTATRAGSLTIGIYATWLTLPWLILILKPILWPGGPNWPVRMALPLLDGSPIGLAMNVLGLIPRPGGLIEAVVRLVVWQVAAGLALIAWAIVRLRPASRAVHDLDGQTSRLRSLRAALRRPYPRPVCGDDPVLWNELYTHRGPSRPGRLLGRVLGLALFGCAVVVTSWFAGPAFAELAYRGYSASPEAFRRPEFNPFIRVLVSRMIIKAPIPPQPGQARLEFNIALREFSAMISLIYALSIFAAVARSVTTERRRDTWLGLIATPLTGREILGAKMMGAVLHNREAALLLIGLWTIGLLAGAVHPVGFLAASTSLIVSASLAASMGVSGLSSHYYPEESYQVLGLQRMLAGTVLSLMVIAIPPLLAYFSLFSYEDIQAVLAGKAFPPFGRSTFPTHVGARGIFAAWCSTSTAMATLALLTTRATFDHFDAAIGRPVRALPPGIPESREVALLPAPAKA